MNRFIALLAITTVLSTTAKAQLNIGVLQDNHNAANAARHLPTFLGDGAKKVQILVFNPYVSLGSNFLTVEEARKYIEADKITSEIMDGTIDKLHPEGNKIAASVDIALLNLSYNLSNRDGKQIASIGVGINQRAEAQTHFNEELFRLVYHGNKQYAGQTVNLIPRFNGVSFTEYSVAAAINIAPGNIGLKPALRLSYLSAQASVAMPKDNSITLFTEQDGRFLDLAFNYVVNTSMDGDSLTLANTLFNVDERTFHAGAGSGFGADLGVRLLLSSHLSFNIGLMDVGSIRFTKGTTNLSGHSSIHYEGEELNFDNDPGFELDSLSSLAEPVYTHEEYTMRLPTKLVLSGCWGLGWVQKEKAGYFKHQLTAMYLQGFSNYLSSTTTPYLAIGYTYCLKNVLNLGANAGVGGHAGGTFGLLASVKAGAFCLGFHSNNVIPLIAPASGRFADFGMLMGFLF